MGSVFATKHAELLLTLTLQEVVEPVYLRRELQVGCVASCIIRIVCGLGANVERENGMFCHESVAFLGLFLFLFFFFFLFFLVFSNALIFLYLFLSTLLLLPPVLQK